jgi:hypothetical protein
LSVSAIQGIEPQPNLGLPPAKTQSRKVSEKKYSELGVLGALARDTLSAIH